MDIDIDWDNIRMRESGYTLTNRTDAPIEKVRVTFAFYKGSNLVSMETKTITLESFVEFAVPAYPAGEYDTEKIMVWDGETLSPFAKAKKLASSN